MAKYSPEKIEELVEPIISTFNDLISVATSTDEISTTAAATKETTEK